MSKLCQRLQKVLIELGPAALKKDHEAQDHLVTCSACFSFLEALSLVDRTLKELPAVDADDALVARTLAAVRAAVPIMPTAPVAPQVAPAGTPPSVGMTPDAARRPRGWRRLVTGVGHALWRVLSAAGSVGWRLLSLAWLVRVLGREGRRRVVRKRYLIPAAATFTVLILGSSLLVLVRHRGSVPLAAFSSSSRFAEITPSRMEPPPAPSQPSPSTVDMPEDKPRPHGVKAKSSENMLRGAQGFVSQGQKPATAREKLSRLFEPGAKNGDDLQADRGAAGTLLGGGGGGSLDGALQDVIEDRRVPDTSLAKQARAQSSTLAGKGSKLRPGAELKDDSGAATHGQDTGGRPDLSGLETTTKHKEQAAPRKVGRRDSGLAGLKPAAPTPAPIVMDEIEGERIPNEPTRGVPAYEAARRFLAAHESLEGVTFKDPTGYWANTYVPGDAEMRLLATQLGQQDRARILSSLGRTLKLDDSARMVAQPFDSPTTSALAVYLQASRRGITEPTRMLLQVGLKGTDRHSRARPAMNVGVVLDLREVPEADGKAAIRALVDALSHARDTGDRFSLILAGKPGGLVVPADSFKHGPLTVALSGALEGVGAPSSTPLSLAEAMQAAIGAVVGADDPNTPLGTSVVMLVTASALGPELATLSDMAHEAAVNGVPVSVVGVGGSVHLSELDTLALAGQGNRRLLAAPVEAASLVDRELSAVSRVVARALRLRIRLAPGVRLVDVIGSYRLDDARAEVIRQAEQSIDRRLSKNLGIASDRGEDEEGIQVVIPSFYAGDTHVILLDVVAPGPGPLADVRVRYKDLVYLKNGVSRTNLKVERATSLSGPLETNVWKNLLAHEVAKAMGKSGVALASGDNASAEEELDSTLALLQGMRVVMPALALDPDVNTDVAMVAEYRTVVSSSMRLDDAARGYVSDSLKYSGFLKVLAR